MHGGCPPPRSAAAGHGGGGSGNAPAAYIAMVVPPSLLWLPLRLCVHAPTQLRWRLGGEGGAHHLGVLIDLLDVPEGHG